MSDHQSIDNLDNIEIRDSVIFNHLDGEWSVHEIVEDGDSEVLRVQLVTPKGDGKKLRVKRHKVIKVIKHPDNLERAGQAQQPKRKVESRKLCEGCKGTHPKHGLCTVRKAEGDTLGGSGEAVTRQLLSSPASGSHPHWGSGRVSLHLGVSGDVQSVRGPSPPQGKRRVVQVTERERN